jgi:hypothetical protein
MLFHNMVCLTVALAWLAIVFLTETPFRGQLDSESEFHDQGENVAKYYYQLIVTETTKYALRGLAAQRVYRYDPLAAP